MSETAEDWLTRDSVLECPAGKTLDMLVAQRVMGWRWYVHADLSHSLHPGERYLAPPEHIKAAPLGVAYAKGDERLAVLNRGKENESHVFSAGVRPFSTDIAAAWDVLAVTKRSDKFSRSLVLEWDEYGWSVGFKEMDHDAGWSWSDVLGPADSDSIDASGAALAICRAALLTTLE